MSTITRIITALLQTLEETTETSTDYISRGHMYAAMMAVINLDQFNAVLSIMVENGWITQTTETVSLTDEGRKIVQSAKIA